MARQGFGRFQPDSSGISSVFRSGAMVSALKAIADPIGEACEAEAVEYASEELDVKPGEIRIRPMYPHGAKVLSNTAVGYVNVRGLGKANETANHSLSRRNH